MRRESTEEGLSARRRSAVASRSVTSTIGAPVSIAKTYGPRPFTITSTVARSCMIRRSGTVAPWTGRSTRLGAKALADTRCCAIAGPAANSTLVSRVHQMAVCDTTTVRMDGSRAREELARLSIGCRSLTKRRRVATGCGPTPDVAITGVSPDRVPFGTMWTRLLTPAVVVFLFPACAWPQTAQLTTAAQVLDRYKQALGGERAIASVRSMTVRG